LARLGLPELPELPAQFPVLKLVQTRV